MRFLSLLLVAAAVSGAILTSAEARDGCGRGLYFNGYRCVPMQARGHYYRADPAPGFRGYGRPLGGGMVMDRSGGVGCVQRGFTVQDGVCKPYRGY